MIFQSKLDEKEVLHLFLPLFVEKSFFTLAMILNFAPPPLPSPPPSPSPTAILRLLTLPKCYRIQWIPQLLKTWNKNKNHCLIVKF